jgi:hypothetical protein
LAWQLRVKCSQVECGTVVGIYVLPHFRTYDVFYKCKCTLCWCGVKCRTRGTPTASYWGYPNYFSLQPMAAGGWDDAAWAAKGLPTSGEMLLQLHMHSVN